MISGEVIFPLQMTFNLQKIATNSNIVSCHTSKETIQSVYKHNAHNLLVNLSSRFVYIRVMTLTLMTLTLTLNAHIILMHVSIMIVNVC